MKTKESTPEQPEDEPSAHDEVHEPSELARPRSHLRVIESEPQPHDVHSKATVIDKTRRPSIFRFKEFTIPPVLERERELRAGLAETPSHADDAVSTEEALPLAAQVALPSETTRRRYGLLIAIATGIALVILLSALWDRSRTPEVARKKADVAGAPAPALPKRPAPSTSQVTATASGLAPAAASAPATRVNSPPKTPPTLMHEPPAKSTAARPAMIPPAPPPQPEPALQPVLPNSSLPIDRVRPF